MFVSGQPRIKAWYQESDEFRTCDEKLRKGKMKIKEHELFDEFICFKLCTRLINLRSSCYTCISLSFFLEKEGRDFYFGLNICICHCYARERRNKVVMLGWGARKIPNILGKKGVITGEMTAWSFKFCL